MGARPRVARIHLGLPGCRAEHSGVWNRFHCHWASDPAPDGGSRRILGTRDFFTPQRRLTGLARGSSGRADNQRTRRIGALQRRAESRIPRARQILGNHMAARLRPRCRRSWRHAHRGGGASGKPVGAIDHAAHRMRPTCRRGERFLGRPVERPAPPLAWSVVRLMPSVRRGACSHERPGGCFGFKCGDTQIWSECSLAGSRRRVMSWPGQAGRLARPNVGRPTCAGRSWGT